MTRNYWLVAIAGAVVALLVRLPGLGTFMTVDEENWMLRSDLFYNVLAEGNPGGTFMTTHPGATAMWLIGGGMSLQEKLLGFPVTSNNLLHFHKSAVAPMALATALLIGAVTFLAIPLLGLPAAGVAGFLLAVDPYLIGSSQIAHLDALQALLMLPALLAWINYVRNSNIRFAILAGVATGLAMGVKLVLALWLFPIFLGITLVYSVALKDFSTAHGWSTIIHAIIPKTGLVVGVAMLTFFAVWPALWVKEDVAQSFQRDVGTILTEEHVNLAAADEPIAPVGFYIRTILGRTTPFIQVALVVGGMFALYRYVRSILLSRREKGADLSAVALAWLGVYAVGFIILITFAAKKGDRYALPALVALPVIAGAVIIRITEHIRLQRRSHILNWAILGLIGLGLIYVPLRWAPHTIAYNNPWFDVRPLSQQGWGEGLEEAAAWLNELPLAEKTTIASWYPSVMRNYFIGKTFILNARHDLRVSYVVIYRNMGGRAQDTLASDVLDEFRNLRPIHTVTIEGVEYAWIYQTLGVGYFIKHVGELYGDLEVGQTVSPGSDGWNEIEVGFATFSSRNNTEDVVVHIRTDEHTRSDIRTVRINAKQIVDNEWHSITFPVIPDAAGRTYYVGFSSPTSQPGNAVTVRYIDEDVIPGAMVWRRHTAEPGELKVDSGRVGDLAVRIPSAK